MVILVCLRRNRPNRVELQVSRKKTLLNKLLKSTEEARVLHEK